MRDIWDFTKSTVPPWTLDEELESTDPITTRGKVHQKILDLLAPQEWVPTEKISEATGQSNYARRIRELRDEEGWKIETRKGAKAAYRLESLEQGVGFKRNYIGEKKRQFVFQRDGFVCQICKRPTNNPQPDHKIPVMRGGSDEVDNLQTACSAHNILKMRACGVCTLTSCLGCPWAFPELIED
jgi:hypothetical protein